MFTTIKPIKTDPSLAAAQLWESAHVPKRYARLRERFNTDTRRAYKGITEKLGQGLIYGLHGPRNTIKSLGAAVIYESCEHNRSALYVTSDWLLWKWPSTTQPSDELCYRPLHDNLLVVAIAKPIPQFHHVILAGIIYMRYASFRDTLLLIPSKYAPQKTFDPKLTSRIYRTGGLYEIPNL